MPNFPAHVAKEYELASKRFAVFLREVIDPALFSARCELTTEIAQWQDPKAVPPTPAAARAAAFRAIAPGTRWGPRWSTAWFRVRGAVPSSFAPADHAVPVLRFSCGTEAQLWLPDAAGHWTPFQAFDANRDAAYLSGPNFPAALLPRAGLPAEFFIEAACNHPFGVSVFEWDGIDTWHRWNSEDPGRFERAELALLDPRVRDLRWAYAFALDLLKELPPDSPRGAQLLAALRAATRRIDSAAPALHAAAVAAELRAALAATPGGTATLCHTVGHAHIDTAWLWPLRETRRKCLRTFSSVLRLMERFPDFRFLCSQAQQYAYAEADAPALFQQIAARVREGRWEPNGGMWIESDCNLISGESLIRQVLHGTRYFAAKFGAAAPQSFLYLPDTFGFPASLPQIMAVTGLRTFITNKLHWNQVNVFPHTTFIWRGIDGTEVLAHNTPGGDYNATNTPRELRKGEAQHANKDVILPASTTPPAAASCPDVPGSAARWLQPFGFGDGGGGPADWNIAYAQFAAQAEGLPRVTLGRADAFCTALHHDRAALRAAGTDFPAHFGELYLEYHRGTYTTHARVKRENCRAEASLRAAELLLSAGPHAAADPASPGSDPRPVLDAAWKTTLLNQFHDIIPGSSIGWVYEDAAADYTRIQRDTTALIHRGLHNCASHLPRAAGAASQTLLLNPASTPRRVVIEAPDSNSHSLAFADIPALGLTSHAAPTLPADVAPVTLSPLPPAADGLTRFALSNGLLTAIINSRGHVESLVHAATGFDAAAAAPLNQLALFEDRPIMYDAWEIEPDYQSKPRFLTAPAASCTISVQSPLRAELILVHRLSSVSTLTQRIRLDAASPRLDFLTHVDWHEARTLLRVLHPTPITAAHTTCGIPFGYLARPTHSNTPWDDALFEVPCHGFIDAATPGRGLALLSDYKFGFSGRLNTRIAALPTFAAPATPPSSASVFTVHSAVTLGLSLLRSPQTPDPTADLGDDHHFTYSLMPHAGEFIAAGVLAEAEALAFPVIASAAAPASTRVPAATHPSPAQPTSATWTPLAISTTGAAGVTIAALKPAEDGPDLILRLVERHGGAGRVTLQWHIPAHTVTLTDALEQPLPPDSPLPRPALTHIPAAAGATTTLDIQPFQIITLRVARAD